MFDAEALDAAPPVAAAADRLQVEALSRSPTHSFGKTPCTSLMLLKGLGVEGDAHCGATDQHLALGKPNPPPNLRQLHLFSGELMEELKHRGFAVGPGAMGENIATRGLDLIALPLGARLVFPSGAVARLTGIRTPCRLLDRLGKGLMAALRGNGAWGENPIAGVMAVIETSGVVRVADCIEVISPAGPHVRLPSL